MPFDANGNWSQPNDPGMGYTQGGGVPNPSFDYGMNNGMLIGGAAPPSLGGTPIDMSGSGMRPNSGAPPGWTAPPPGTVIPSTPGDPTHGGMFGPSGYMGPQQNNQQIDPYAMYGGSLLTPYPQQFSYPGVYGSQPGSQSGYGSPGGYGALSSSTGGGLPPGANPMDPAVIRQWVQQQGMGSGTDPSATNDPDYWVRTIQQHGGLTSDNMGYFGGRITNPNSGGGGGFGGGFGNLSPMSPFQFGSFNYTPQQISNVSAPTPMSAPTPFSFGSYSAPQAYQPGQFGYQPPVPTNIPQNTPFVAPNLNETNDPGYQFRLQQGEQAIQNQASAQGARGGDVLKALQDYAQGQASSEYGNVYGRAFGQYTNQQQEQLNLYNAALTAQNQGYSQAYGTSALNNQNSLAAAALNSQNALAAYQTNYNVASGVNQQNFQNAFNVYNANAGNQMQAAALSEQAQAQNAQLGWQAASGVFDRNYQNALNSYQMQWQQQLAAAGLGFQYAGLGLQAQGQGFNQAATAYGMNQGNYYTGQGNAYNRLSGVAGYGANAAGSLSGAAGQYGANVGGLYTGQANANAGAQISAGNAWGNAFNGMGNSFGTGLLYGSNLNPWRGVPSNSGIPRTPGIVPVPGVGDYSNASGGGMYS